MFNVLSRFQFEKDAFYKYTCSMHRLSLKLAQFEKETLEVSLELNELQYSVVLADCPAMSFVFVC